MNQAATLDSYRQKLIDAEPVFALIERFIAPERRARQMAFECLLNELVDAALRIAEPQVSLAKLAWWRDELLAVFEGRARHPICVALLTGLPRERAAPEGSGLRSISLALPRDLAPVDGDSQLQRLASWFEEIFRFGAQLNVNVGDFSASGRLRARHLIVRELARLGREPQTELIGMPLNLLARHRLTRTQLNVTSDARSAAIKDRLGELRWGAGSAGTGSARAGMSSRVLGRLDQASIRSALRATDPALALSGSRQLRFGALWAVWRAAREGQ